VGTQRTLTSHVDGHQVQDLGWKNVERNRGSRDLFVQAKPDKLPCDNSKGFQYGVITLVFNGKMALVVNANKQLAMQCRVPFLNRIQ
jgi:hypothetical protein